MSGFYTPGLPTATPSNLTATATIPVDTNLGQGVTPQSVQATPAQIVNAAQGAIAAQTFGATLTIDASALPGGTFSETLTGAQTLTLTNMAPGQVLYGYITQDGTGTRIITVAAGTGGATLVSGTPLSTAAGSKDLVAIKNVGTLAAPVFAYYPIAKALA